MKKNFVTFLSPGTLMAENSTKPIDSWDVGTAQKMAGSITERYGAKPYAFYFTTRERSENELDSHETDRSGNYFLPHCKVETLEELKHRKNPKEEILIANMEGNGHDRVATTVSGWKWTQYFNDNDVLLEPRSVKP